MNKLLKYTLSSTLLMGVAFADNHGVGDPFKAQVVGGGSDGVTPLVVADNQDKKTSRCVDGKKFGHDECDKYKNGAMGATEFGIM